MSDHISASDLSHYIRLDMCARFLRFRIRPDEAKTFFTRFSALGIQRKPLTQLLYESGRQFEDRVIAALPQQPVDCSKAIATDILHLLTGLQRGESVILVQATVEGSIGGWPCTGRADIIQASRASDGRIALLVADIKASRNDRVEYYLQVCFYLHLLRTMLDQAGERVSQAEGAILKLAEDGSLPLLDDPNNRFDLAPYERVLARLFEGDDADLAQIERMPFNQVPYSLGYKCDGCTYNGICMVDSADRQDLRLTPYIRPAAIRALQRSGLHTLHDMGSLSEQATGDMQEIPAPDKAAIVAQLRSISALSLHLDELVARARAILHRFDPGVITSSTFPPRCESSLPSDATNPDLVKIFLDGQRDFVQDRLYLLGALVQGPLGSIPIVHFSPAPPTDADEQVILLRTIQALFAALPQVARDPHAVPIHLYVYDGHDQRVLLDALSRHLDTLQIMLPLFDMLTATPALEHSMVSSLAYEIREQRNLDMTCQNLYDVARYLGFEWSTEQDDFIACFYSGIFDNRTRRDDGIWIERYSRFDSSIPLEYAYGAWKQVPDGGNETQGFRGCTPDLLQRFQQHRLRALACIERELAQKDLALIKAPIDLATFDVAVPPSTDLAHALEEFLLLEHYASYHEHLRLYAQPVERRVQAGRSLLLICTALHTEGREVIGDFQIDFERAGLDPAVAEQALRLKEGDWVVFNTVDTAGAKEIIHGRLAVITDLGNSRLQLKLLNNTLRQGQRSSFRYWHRVELVPEIGAIYTIDEMADDLNADKQREAIRNSATNVLFAQLTGYAPPVPQEVYLSRLSLFQHQMYRLDSPTRRQSTVIEQHHTTPLLLVQGPPGTGKSHTLGWAVLARILTHGDRPFRVAVCAVTHKAITIVLESIAKKVAALRQTNLGRAMGEIGIYKASSEWDDELPKGVRSLPYSGNPARVKEAFAEQVGVIGATPGGIYSLVQQYDDRQIDWDRPLFDLLVIDEASQMNIPEAILASAFLKPDGQMIVVGDHRQMPPILAHNWERERRRSQAPHQIHDSIFATLIKRGFPVVRLDRSFRLHQSLAQFLDHYVYRQDAIQFHSTRQDLLKSLGSTTDPYIALALRNEYPIVIIEHDEAGSLQLNELETALAMPLIDACTNGLKLDGNTGIGVVVPHRAQKAALRVRFPELAAAQAIDTVERFQGGERDVIIVLATASDQDYILAEAAFLLNPNRLNVAISRPRKKLIVIASTTIFRTLSADLDLFTDALLWKHLRYDWTTEQLWQGTRDGHTIRIFGHHCGHNVPNEDRQQQPAHKITGRGKAQW